MAGSKAKSPLDGKSVQELQVLAAEAAALHPAPPRRRLSRAALLYLIDQLSRWGGSGLALFAGVAIFLSITARQQPVRAFIWTAIMFAALYACRRFRKEFRRGDRIAARPFRWRAYYTASIAVVSAAFGAGAFLLVPAKALGGFGSLETLALLFIASCAASILHIAHRPTALAAGLPALLLIAGAAFVRVGPGPLSTFVATASVLCVGALVALSGESARRAASRFPRTSFVRREVERPVQGEVARPLSGDRAAAI